MKAVLLSSYICVVVSLSDACYFSVPVSLPLRARGLSRRASKFAFRVSSVCVICIFRHVPCKLSKQVILRIGNVSCCGVLSPCSSRARLTVFLPACVYFYASLRSLPRALQPFTAGPSTAFTRGDSSVTPTIYLCCLRTSSTTISTWSSG